MDGESVGVGDGWAFSLRFQSTFHEIGKLLVNWITKGKNTKNVVEITGNLLERPMIWG